MNNNARTDRYERGAGGPFSQPGPSGPWVLGHRRGRALQLVCLGDVSKVVGRVQEHLRRIEAGETSTPVLNPVVIFTGGGQQGVVGAGVFLGMGRHVAGFNTCIGISTGCAPFLYHNEADYRGISIFWQENVERRLFNLARPWRILDLAGLERVFRHEKPPRALHALKEHRTRFLIGVYDRRLRRERFIDAGKATDMVTWAVRSMAVPVFHPWSRYVDGDLGAPLPIRFAIEELHATDVLVVMSTWPALTSARARRVGDFAERMLRLVPHASYARAFASYPTRIGVEMDLLLQGHQDVNVAAIVPRISPLSPMCQDASLLEQCAREAERFARTLFEGRGS